MSIFTACGRIAPLLFLQWFGSLESPFISLHFGGEMVTGTYQNVQTYTKIQNKCQKQSLYNSNKPESQYLI